MKVKSESEVAQSCLTLSDPMDCSPPGSSVHGIFQARVLEWGANVFPIGEFKPFSVQKGTLTKLWYQDPSAGSWSRWLWVLGPNNQRRTASFLAKPPVPKVIPHLQCKVSEFQATAPWPGLWLYVLWSQYNAAAHVHQVPSSLLSPGTPVPGHTGHCLHPLPMPGPLMGDTVKSLSLTLAAGLSSLGSQCWVFTYWWQ